jgi:hypothetical protein
MPLRCPEAAGAATIRQAISAVLSDDVDHVLVAYLEEVLRGRTLSAVWDAPPALDDRGGDSLHLVSDFAYLAPQQRPAAVCPVCREAVVLKLGTVRTHHYAHRADGVCAATQPETALHLNTKFYLARQLRYASDVQVVIPCQNQCGAVSRRLWLQGWDAVAVEYRSERFRPDIALLRGEMILGAIEVVVTHPVHPEKQAHFAAKQIAWVEVAGDAAIYDGTPSWTVEEPLPVIVGRGSLERWTCAACEAAAAEAASQATRQRTLRVLDADHGAADAAFRKTKQAEQHVNRQIIHGAKIVDFYCPDGRMFREVYIVIKQDQRNDLAYILATNRKRDILARVEVSAGRFNPAALLTKHTGP